ncbi:Fc.00g028060.m01.CDS01 [Cosmosporella sp. VM-42]
MRPGGRGQCWRVILILACLGVNCQQREGAQSFQLLDKLWIDGGRYLDENVPQLLSANLTLDFASPPGPVLNSSARPNDVPLVSHGFMWSNLVDRAWLYGGMPLNVNDSAQNDIWRFTTNNESVQWNRLDIRDGSPGSRPSYGAGCNVPDLKKGYYLGGMTSGKPEPVTYLHSLAVFDTDTETLSTIPVPDFVPVVNQSLVFLNTATRRGALVALGGYTERNGSLSMAPMASVYIFDIASQTWIEQAVTSLDGDSNEDYQDNGRNFSTWQSLPSRRISACAAVGSSQDKTSHTIAILGGQNDVTALADTWVLNFGPNYPTAGSSCLLLNSRFMLMFGGCLLDVQTGQPCKSYSDGPFNYDISLLLPLDYTHQTVGFQVPQRISNAIGGNSSEELFKPPHGSWLYGPFWYESMVMKGLVALLLAPIAIVAPVSGGFWLLNRLGIARESGRDWRPFPFGYRYLSLINLTTACFVALVLFVLWRSHQPDSLVEHWHGGPSETGAWTGERFTSTFIRSPTYDRPPQGLLSFYYNGDTTGIFNKKNGTQRLSRAVYWIFTFLPTLLAVLYGRLWKLLDDEVKRNDMYHRLQKRGGTTGERSLCLNYHVFWSPLSIVQAVRYRHWSVAVSSLGSFLSSLIIPIFQNYVFYWEVYDGAQLPWSSLYSWQVALVDQTWAYRLVGALAAAWICSVALLLMLPRQQTGLDRIVEGIAGLLSLLEEDDKLGLQERCGNRPLSLEQRTLQESMSEQEKFGRERLVLTRQQPGNLRKVLQQTAAPILAVLSSLSTPWNWCRKYIKRYLSTFDRPLPFRYELFGPWLILLFLLMFSTGWITASLNKNAKNEEWNYSVPVNPDIFLIVGIFIQSIVDVIDNSVRGIAPFYALAQKYQTPDVLWADYRSGIPLWEAWIACRNGHYLLCSTMLSGLATTILTIFLGALQLSSSSYGSTTFEGDLSAATASTILSSFILVVHLVLGYHFTWPRTVKFADRPPQSVAEMLPYIVFSEGLKADLRRVASKHTTKEKIAKLELLDRRYGFGDFKIGDKWYIRVERHYGEASAFRTPEIIV